MIVLYFSALKIVIYDEIIDLQAKIAIICMHYYSVYTYMYNTVNTIVTYEYVCMCFTDIR